jgi:cell division protein FtsW
VKRTSQIFKWFRSIDKLTFFLVLIISAIGLTLVASAGPAIAQKVGLPRAYFIKNHIFYLSISLVLMVIFSCFSREQIQKISGIALIIVVIFVICTLLQDSGIKGAKRWIRLFGFSLQPSEFLKPFFCVVCASFLSLNTKNLMYVAIMYSTISALLLLQPDFGMFVMISIIFFTAVFTSRVHILFMSIFLLIFFIVVTFAYLFIPHVQYRVNNFFNSSAGDNFQTQKAKESMLNGGLFGIGPSEGKVKLILPDAHTDFIFSVAAEEFGLICTMTILALYFTLIIHNFLRFLKFQDEFCIIASFAITTYFAMQALINIGVNLALLPTKGMTLPFISYGGSSVLASGIAIGIILSLSKKSYILSLKN